ncbi:MAG: 2-hydroxyacid dehydrogenase [Gemmobacter sp.]|nr:2-hydroxyacid dehydrogenase [Gemmobacter sp.]
MTKPQILQLTRYPAGDQAPLDAAFTMHKLFEAPDKAAFLAQHGPDIRAIAGSGSTPVTRSLIEACPNLELVSVFGVGVDSIDLVACSDHGVRVTNTPDVLSGDCADLAVGMMLALSRGMVGADAWVRDGSWASKGSYPLQRRAWGKRAGILGLGRIGTALAWRLEGFGMQIAYTARRPHDVPAGWTYIPDPADLAAQSDVLFLTLSASAGTRHIVDARVIAALGPSGMLVNISRGSTVDEEALLTALESGALAGAALDVFETEPQVNPRFLPLQNVLLQPHQASGTTETRQAMGQLLRDNLTAHFAGQPLLTPVT